MTSLLLVKLQKQMIHKFITDDVAITAVPKDFYSWQQIIATAAIHLYAEVRIHYLNYKNF